MPFGEHRISSIWQVAPPVFAKKQTVCVVHSYIFDFHDIFVIKSAKTNAYFFCLRTIFTDTTPIYRVLPRACSPNWKHPFWTKQYIRQIATCYSANTTFVIPASTFASYTGNSKYKVDYPISRLSTKLKKIWILRLLSAYIYTYLYLITLYRNVQRGKVCWQLIFKWIFDRRTSV